MIKVHMKLINFLPQSREGDVKSSRELFISSMGKLKQISLMLNQIAANQPISKSEMENKKLPDYTQTIKRYEMNIKKQMQFSDRLGCKY